MSIVQRKPRPLKRDTNSLRDDRLFIIACDDTYAPKQYFNFFRIIRVQVHVITTKDGSSSAKHVLNRLLEYDHEEDDELWMLLDTDHCTQGSHQSGFIQAIRDAKARNVNVALSKPCFEFWLLLHHVEKETIVNLSNAKETEQLLRETLGEYNKINLKQTHYPLATVSSACIKAAELDLLDNSGDIPNNNTNRVYLSWKSIVAKGLPSQLPEKLNNLLSGSD